MKYLCANPECNFTFTHPAKLIIIDPDFLETVSKLKDGQFLSRPNEASGYEPRLEVCVCPNCHKITFNEYTEPDATVESVYIYELTSGPQTELNGLLAQGYVIVNRYAKAYHLEKPKAIVEKDYVAEALERAKQ